MLIRVFSPASPEAGNLLWLWDVCMWICGLILAVVTGSLIYILIRFRRRDDQEPDQHTGNRKLEIAWTAVPIGLVASLFVLSVITARAVDKPTGRAPDIVVTGHQWWWEVSYPAAKVTTANEVHLPIHAIPTQSLGVVRRAHRRVEGAGADHEASGPTAHGLDVRLRLIDIFQPLQYDPNNVVRVFTDAFGARAELGQ